LPDHINLRDVNPISDYILSEYQKGNYDKVVVAYTDFVSALTQRPNIKQILPISKIELKDLIDNLPPPADGHLPRNSGEEKGGVPDYLFEGDPEKFIGKLAEKITKMQIYQMLLESNASEQSSRMIAMKNASEASGEMIDDLTLMFNKARQSNITREISEISAGMASVS
jgi:F-type H+-transporting ATPase subunit gamma